MPDKNSPLKTNSHALKKKNGEQKTWKINKMIKNKEHKTKSLWSSSGECTRFLLSIVKIHTYIHRGIATATSTVTLDFLPFFGVRFCTRLVVCVNIDGECELKTKRNAVRYAGGVWDGVKKRRKCMLTNMGERFAIRIRICLRVWYLVFCLQM